MLKTVSLLVTFVALTILYANSSPDHTHGISPLPISEQVSNLTTNLPQPQPMRTPNKTAEITLAATTNPAWSLSVPEPSSLPIPKIEESSPSASPSATPSAQPKIIPTTKLADEEEAQSQDQSSPAPTATPQASPSVTQSPTPKSTPTTITYSGTTPPGSLDADKIFSLVNNYRTSINLPAFQKDDRSCSLAASRAPEINHEIAISHMHIGLKNRNLNYWNTENIISMNSEQAAFNWWMNDKIHHDAIVGNYKYSCVACYKNACAEEFTNFESKI